jgi:chemotaxis-related protein WspD
VSERAIGEALYGLLDRALPDDYRLEWTSHIAAETSTKTAGTASCLIFRIGSEWLALPTAICERVTEARPIHSLPHRHDGLLRGLTNVHGELLICVSLGRLLGIGRPEASPSWGLAHTGDRLVVINRGGERFVVWVSEVHGTHRYDPSELRDPPATLTHSGRTFTKGLLPWQDTTVNCLDDELVVYALAKGIA